MNPDQTRLAKRWRQLAPPVVGISALMLFLVVGRPPGDSYGWRMVFEIGHVPLFGVTGLLMLRIVRLLRGRADPAPADFLIALLATAVLSLVAEAGQLVQPGRHANVGDAIANLTGAFCFIAIAAALRPEPWQGLGRDGPVAARLVLIGSTLALGLAVMPLVGVAWSYGARAVVFPVLADFNGGWQRPFLHVGRSELARVPAPAGWVDKAGGQVARLTFLDAPWPGVVIREPYPDWSGYQALRFQLWSELDAPVELVLRVDDTHRERSHRDRFNASFIVTPGLNDFTVPLSTIAHGPRDRQLDVSDISQIILFSRRPDEPFELYLGRFWLEGGEERIAEVP
jgi:VanZ family protein